MTAQDFQIFNDEMISRLVGVKYKVCGDTMDGMDCSGLVKHIYSLIGVDLKNALFSGEVYTQKAVLQEFKNELSGGDWVQIEQPEHGCLVAMSHCKIVRHCGVWLEGQRIIHSTNGVGVRVQQAREIRSHNAFKFTFYKWHEFS